VKILTNCHNLFRNPLHWPICVLRKCIPPGSKYDVTVLTSSLPFPWAKFLFVVALLLSVAPFSGVVSCQIRRVWNYFSYHGLCPPVAQLGASARHFHRPLAFYGISSPSNQIYFWIHQKKIWWIFFLTGWTVCHGHVSVGGARGTRARWY
jgi:hypothetical protein